MVAQIAEKYKGFTNMLNGQTYYKTNNFIDELARTFVGAANASPYAMIRAREEAARPPQVFTSSGFQGQFVDPTELTANQARHYTGGFVAAYNAAAAFRDGRERALTFMNNQERRGRPDFEPDTALNAVSTRHGAMFNNRTNPRTLADLIRNEVCGPR